MERRYEDDAPSKSGGTPGDESGSGQSAPDSGGASQGAGASSSGGGGGGANMDDLAARFANLHNF